MKKHFNKIEHSNELYKFIKGNNNIMLVHKPSEIKCDTIKGINILRIRFYPIGFRSFTAVYIKGVLKRNLHH